MWGREWTKWRQSGWSSGLRGMWWRLLRPGQQTRVRLDSYPDAEWRGHIDTISPASGAEFAVLLPQNASGNWVKVV